MLPVGQAMLYIPFPDHSLCSGVLSCCRARRLAHIQEFLLDSAVCALPDGFCALQATPGLQAGPPSNTASSPTDVSDVDLGGLLLDVEASMPLPGVMAVAL